MCNPNNGTNRLRELFMTKFKSPFIRGFTRVVLTRDGRLREKSQGELRLCQNLREKKWAKSFTGSDFL